MPINSNYRLSQSLSFLYRTKCKFCGSKPYYFYNLSNNPYYKNARDYIKNMYWVRKSLKSIRARYYLDATSWTTLRVSDYFVVPPYNGYKSVIHKTIPGKINDHIISNSSEIAFCKCMSTSWEYNVETADSRGRVDIINRKAPPKLI